MCECHGALAQIGFIAVKQVSSRDNDAEEAVAASYSLQHYLQALVLMAAIEESKSLFDNHEPFGVFGSEMAVERMLMRKEPPSSDQFLGIDETLASARASAQSRQ